MVNVVYRLAFNTNLGEVANISVARGNPAKTGPEVRSAMMGLISANAVITNNGMLNTVKSAKRVTTATTEVVIA